LVESRERILSKTKLALRMMKFFCEPMRRPRAKLAELEICPELQEKTLDNADDVIHGLRSGLQNSTSNSETTRRLAYKLAFQPQQVPLGCVGEPDSWVGMVWVVGTVYGVVPARLATHS